TNAHAVLQAPPRGRSAEAAAGISDATGGFNFIVPLSAASAPALNDVAKRHLEALEQGELKHARLEDICFSAGARRTHHDFRLALVAKDKGDLAGGLAAFLGQQPLPGIHSGRRLAQPARPVFVCSGMGQQWWAMGRELLASEPIFKVAVEEVSSLFARLSGWSLIEAMSAP